VIFLSGISMGFVAVSMQCNPFVLIKYLDVLGIMVSGFAPNGIEKTFEMYTTTGQKVLEISVKADQTSIDISTAGLKNGLYLYRSNTKDQSVSVGKIVVLH